MNRTARRSRGVSNRIASIRRRSRPHDEAAEQRRRDVVRVALDLGREVEQVRLGQRLAERARCRRRGPPTAAAADEPRPRASGIALRISTRQPTPSGISPRTAPEGGLDARTNRLLAVAGELAGALALHGQLDLAAAPAADLDLDPVRQAEGQPRQSYPAPRLALVAGTSTVTRRPSSSASQFVTIRRHRRARRPTVGSGLDDAQLGGGRGSAVSGSFSPFPVRTHTTSHRASRRPCRGERRDPRRRRRRRRLAEDPLVAARSR